VDGRARAARVCRFAGDKVIDCVVRHSRRARNTAKNVTHAGGGGTARRSDATDGRLSVLRAACTRTRRAVTVRRACGARDRRKARSGGGGGTADAVRESI